MNESESMLFARQETRNHVLEAFCHTCCLRPWTWLPEYVEMTAFIEHLIITNAARFSKESQIDGGFADPQICNCQFWHPLRKMGIDDERVERGKGIDSQHALQDYEESRGRPCLWRIRVRINRRKRVVVITRVPGENLGQTIELKEPRCFE